MKHERSEMIKILALRARTPRTRMACLPLMVGLVVIGPGTLILIGVGGPGVVGFGIDSSSSSSEDEVSSSSE